MSSISKKELGIGIGIVVIILIILLAVGISANGGLGSQESKLTGNWVCHEVHKSYPDQMVIKDDGTAVIDGESGSWTADNGQLTLYLGVIYGDFSYNYHFSGSTLYLDNYGYDKK